MTSNRRLQFVIGSLDRGGAEQHLLQLLPRLAGQGWEVSVYCLSHEGELAAEFERHNIPVVTPALPGGRAGQSVFYRACRLLVACTQLWWRLLRQRPAIVHFFLPHAYLSGVPVALLAGRRRLVMSRRSLDHYQRSRPGLARFERGLHRWMSAVCGNSRAVLAQLQAEGVADESLVLIYNGVELPPAGDRSAIRRRQGCPQEALVFIVVANLIPYKGHADLIRALAGVRDLLPRDWRLWLVGRDAGYGKELRALLNEVGLLDQVSLLGSREDVPGLLQAADIAVLPSHQEGFSNAILEAMAAGLPVVATDVGGNAEAIVDGETGRLVPVGDTRALGQALAALAGDPQRRRLWGQAGRERVRRLFAVDAMVSAYLRLYDALLTRGRPADENRPSRTES